MATSGKYDITTTRDAIITECMEQQGVLAEGGTPTAAQVTSMARTLEWMIKHIQNAHGGHLFTKQRWFVFLKKSQHEYTLTNNASDNFCKASLLVNTFTSAVASATDLTIEVDSITGISASDRIGVEVAGNVMHWTTVDGAPSGTTVTIAVALPAAVAVDAQVYTYTPVATVAGRREMPLQVLSAHRRTKFVASNGDEGTDIPLTELTLEEYEDLSVKTADGAVNQWYYNPQRLTGELFLWPETSDETDFVMLWVVRPIEDFEAASTEPDYPQEWFLTLAYNLAKFTLTKYGVDQARSELILGLAAETLRDSLARDTEMAMKLMPDERWS